MFQIEILHAAFWLVDQPERQQWQKAKKVNLEVF